MYFCRRSTRPSYMPHDTAEAGGEGSEHGDNTSGDKQWKFNIIHDSSDIWQNLVVPYFRSSDVSGASSHQPLEYWWWPSYHLHNLSFTSYLLETYGRNDTINNVAALKTIFVMLVYLLLTSWLIPFSTWFCIWLAIPLL